MNVSTNGNTVFEWFVNISSITGLITWDIILITYVRFYRGLAYNNIDRNTLPYKAPFQPYASYFGIFFISIIILFNGFQVFLSGEWVVDTFITAYICLPIFVVFYLFWKIAKRPKFVRIEDMDFTTGRRELNESESRHQHVYRGVSDRIYTVDTEETAKYVEPKGIFAKTWDWLSEYHSHSPPKTYAHYVFLTSVNCYDATSTTDTFLYIIGHVYFWLSEID
jgi:amino acid transporter